MPKRIVRPRLGDDGDDGAGPDRGPGRQVRDVRRAETSSTSEGRRDDHGATAQAPTVLISDEDLHKLFAWIRLRHVWRARKYLARHYAMSYGEAEAWCLEVEGIRPWTFMD